MSGLTPVRPLVVPLTTQQSPKQQSPLQARTPPYKETLPQPQPMPWGHMVQPCDHPNQWQSCPLLVTMVGDSPTGCCVWSALNNIALLGKQC